MLKPSVAVIYPHYPHYRDAIFQSLINSDEFVFDFYFSRNVIDKTIAESDRIKIGKIVPSIVIGPFVYQLGLHRKIASGQYHAVIFLGNPYFLSVWVYAFIARMASTKVLFWTHGWLSREKGIRSCIRKLFYRLADGLLLYGNKARQIGADLGFNSECLHVVYNSLDYEKQKAIRNKLLNFRAKTAEPEAPLLFVGRLVPEVQLELLIDALVILRERNFLVPRVLIVGSGPERARLESKSSLHALNVEFCGPIYSEEELGVLFLDALCVVSPGKVGLLAMHALAYGAVVVTHGNSDKQMPEFEALRQGVTAELFNEGEAQSLAFVLADLLKRQNPRQNAAIAIADIEQNYTPEKQRDAIEGALRKHLSLS